jgi:hypothetical protein
MGVDQILYLIFLTCFSRYGHHKDAYNEREGFNAIFVTFLFHIIEDPCHDKDPFHDMFEIEIEK